MSILWEEMRFYILTLEFGRVGLWFVSVLCRALSRLPGLTFPGLGGGYGAPDLPLSSVLPSVRGPGTAVSKEPSE